MKSALELNGFGNDGGGLSGRNQNGTSSIAGWGQLPPGTRDLFPGGFRYVAKWDYRLLTATGTDYGEFHCFPSAAVGLPLQAADMFAWEVYQHSLAYLKVNGKPEFRKQLKRLWQGERMDVGFASRDAIEKMVAIESAKGEHFARAAELLTISDEELLRRLNEPVPDTEPQPPEA